MYESKKLVPPSSPNPDHLHAFQVSLVDQVQPPVYTSEALLPGMLAVYYHFAGWNNDEDALVECDDLGVEYWVVEVGGCRLESFLSGKVVRNETEFDQNAAAHRLRLVVPFPTVPFGLLGLKLISEAIVCKPRWIEPGFPLIKRASRTSEKGTLRRHLLTHGFNCDYSIWICHGETAPTVGSSVGASESAEDKGGKVEQGNEPEYPKVSASLPKHAKKGGKEAIGKGRQGLDDQKMMGFAYNMNKLRKKHGWNEESFNRLLNSLKSGFPLFNRLPKYSNRVRDAFGDGATTQNRNGSGCSSLTSAKVNPDKSGNKCSTCGQDLKSDPKSEPS
ncbi:hypothetical protein MLD38_032383 [Melastoma candidum]|uniref:Uncharacterized protein n=1 Tax=Melastoma candidum TaxID=119954 RepID=A0ACB9M432_9MYRT|nr:hypothetical protein MLD38_032383 [Melastoma candidum]